MRRNLRCAYGSAGCFFGSKRIPEFARNLGRGMRQFRDATNDIQRDITDSVKDVKKQIENDNQE